MKKTFIAALMLSAGLCASAQSSVVNNPANRGYFGVRASLDVACPGDYKAGNLSVDMYNPGAGFSAGAIYNMPLVANLYFEPGVNLYYNTYKIQEFEISDGILGKGSMRKFGVRVPLQFGYHFDFTPDISVAVFTGPELEIGCTADMHLKASAGNVSESASESVYGDGGMERFDCLWKFGASLTYAHNYYVGIGGGVGMVNMTGDSDLKFHENLVQVTLGYNF